jgi:hypothetical protein
MKVFSTSSLRIICRKFSSNIAASNPSNPSTVATAGPVKSDLSKKVAEVKTNLKNRGSTFFERLTSFLVGCAVGFGSISYFVYNELVESNEKFERDLKNIDSRIEILESTTAKNSLE